MNKPPSINDVLTLLREIELRAIRMETRLVVLAKALGHEALMQSHNKPNRPQ